MTKNEENLIIIIVGFLDNFVELRSIFDQWSNLHFGRFECLYNQKFICTLKVKVQLFWEGHKNLRNLPHGFDIYILSNVKIILADSTNCRKAELYLRIKEIYLNIRTSHRSSHHDHVANAGRFQVQDQHWPKIKQIYMYYYTFQKKICNIFLFLPDPQRQGHVEQTFQDLKKKDIINFRFLWN